MSSRTRRILKMATASGSIPELNSVQANEEYHSNEDRVLPDANIDGLSEYAKNSNTDGYQFNIMVSSEQQNDLNQEVVISYELDESNELIYKDSTEKNYLDISISNAENYFVPPEDDTNVLKFTEQTSNKAEAAKKFLFAEMEKNAEDCVTKSVQEVSESEESEEENQREDENEELQHTHHQAELIEQSKKRKRNENEAREPNKGRKRSKNPTTWVQNLRKTNIRTGNEYTTKKGKVIKKKVLKPPCDVSCKKKCQENFHIDKREKIFTKFWNMGNYNRQSTFVGTYVERVPKKKVTVKENLKENITSRRKSSLNYFLPNGPEMKEVCKKMFLNTLAITDMWVMTALKKKDLSITGTVTPDKRGSHTNRPFVISEEVKKNVKQHIEMFPKIPSHYCRARSNKNYLEEGLSVSIMYRLYVTWATENNIQEKDMATERQYRDLFNTEFNLGFFQPKKDKCETCSAFEINKKTEEILEAQRKHLERKEMARKKKDEDKEEAKIDNKRCVACFDLQKVIQIPRSNTSSFYYKSKLSVFNFTVFDVARREGFCYIWNEQIAKRGANEVASCLFAFMMKMLNSGVKHFIFYSDNCVGQNKNRILVGMYIYFSKKYNVDIEHRFLEPGHTQNENDSIHALIERKCQFVDLYTPDQFAMIVRVAKVTGKPYIVREMDQKSIFDFKKYSEKFTFSKGIVWNDIREIRVRSETPEKVLIKYEFSKDPLTLTVTPRAFAKKTRKSGSNSGEEEQLVTCYSAVLPLNKKKYEHLQFLKNKVPDSCRYFYETLTTDERTNSDLDDSE